MRSTITPTCNMTLRSDSDGVRLHCPRWYRPPAGTFDKIDSADTATLPAPHIHEETR